MGFFKNLWESFRYGSMQSAFASAVKSFADTKGDLNDFLKDVNPEYPLEMIPLLRKFAIINPDLNQSIKRTITLNNSGLDWELDGVSESVKAAAIAEIESWLDQHPGIVNKLMRQIILTGALSAESIPDLALTSIEEIRLIPVQSIRFQREQLEPGKNGETRYAFVPYQILRNGNRARLNEFQYSYEALETDEDNPYAIPPAISAIRSMLTQARGSDNVDRLIGKWGLLGFITMLFKKPAPFPGMDMANTEKQREQLLHDKKAAFEKNSGSGFIAAFDDTKIEHHSIASEKSSGFQDIWRSVEEQISSGMDTDLFMLGRSYSVTEAYAKIAGKLFLLKGKNQVHPVKRFLEKHFALHLRMKGYNFKTLSANWKEGISLDPAGDALAEKAKAETEEIRIRNTFAKVAGGVIQLDDAAKELGYEKATGNPVSKNALQSILSHSNSRPMSQVGFEPVNKYEHGFLADFEYPTGSREPDYVSPDGKRWFLQDNVIDFEKKKPSKEAMPPGSMTKTATAGRGSRI